MTRLDYEKWWLGNYYIYFLVREREILFTWADGQEEIKKGFLREGRDDIDINILSNQWAATHTHTKQKKRKKTSTEK